MGEKVVSLREAERGLKPHFVLVHGIGGGGWCWYKIRCLMENSGYRVSCVDLRSAGIDQTHADSLLSFDDYNKPLMDFMSALPDNEQIILVGHSAGGLSVTEATHKFAKKIRLVVYVAATMLKLGYMTDEDVKDVKFSKPFLALPLLFRVELNVNEGGKERVWFAVSSQHSAESDKGVPDLSEYGDVYKLGFGLGPDQPPTSALVKKEYQRKIIYHLSPLEDSTLAAMLLRPGPIKAIQNARFVAVADEDHNVDKGVPDLSEYGDVYKLGFGLGPDQPPTSALVKKEYQRKIIYHLSPLEDSTLAAMLLRPGPIKAIQNARFVAVADEDHNVDKVPRIYIKTMYDRVVKPEQQAAMIKRWPPSDVYVLDSDHSPFFSTPFLLFGLLVKAVASFGFGLNHL
nr:methylesterase 17 [Quercus suber]